MVTLKMVPDISSLKVTREIIQINYLNKVMDLTVKSLNFDHRIAEKWNYLTMLTVLYKKITTHFI